MTELVLRTSYSPAAMAVMEVFCGRSSQPEARESYEANGLICTNKLGYHMLIVETHEVGPEDVATAVHYSEMSSRSLTFLDYVRLGNPDLWHQALETRASTRMLEERRQREVHDLGSASAETDILFSAAVLQEHTLMSQVFNEMPFTDSDSDLALAVELCA